MKSVPRVSTTLIGLDLYFLEVEKFTSFLRHINRVFVVLPQQFSSVLKSHAWLPDCLLSVFLYAFAVSPTERHFWLSLKQGPSSLLSGKTARNVIQLATIMVSPCLNCFQIFWKKWSLHGKQKLTDFTVLIEVQQGH